MKKFITFLVIMFLLNIKIVDASCSYQEQSLLNNKAANVSVSYELIKEEIRDDVENEDSNVYFNYYFKVSIVNITDDFYVIVKNDYDKIERTYTSKDAVEGIITFKWNNVDKVTNFTIQVYASNQTNCSNDKFKTIYLTTPRYNIYSGRAICLEEPDFYLCQKFVVFDEIDENEFIIKTEKYYSEKYENVETPLENEEKTITDIIFEFIDNNKWLILGGIIVIGSLGITIYKIKTKKQRELGL